MIPILYFCLGASLGSFMGVIWDRFPENSIIWPPSHCDNCKHSLKAQQLIPIFSVLMTGFKCAFCKQRVSPVYSLIELVMGLIFWCAQQHLFLSWIDVYMISISILLSLYDMKTQSYPFIIWIFSFMILLPFYEWNLLVFFFLLIALLCTIWPAVIGNGDFLYLASIALVYDLKMILWIIQIASILGLAFCLVQKKRKIPFLPFLSLALLVLLCLKH
ncbi:prepilin peptidase [Streptococcus uberis]